MKIKKKNCLLIITVMWSLLLLCHTEGSAQCTSGYTSGDLTISGACTISSDITISGALKFSSDATLVIGAGVTVTVTGNFETGIWPGGTYTISGGGTLDIAGRFYNNIYDKSLTISNMTVNVGNNGGTNESKNEYGSILNLENGTLFTVTDGNFVNGNSADLTIDNSTMTINSGNYKNDSGSATTVQNGGSLIVSDGDLTTEGGSQLMVDNSTVNISNDFNNSFQAQLDIINNSTFTIGGTFDNGYDTNGNPVNEGYINVNGSNLNVGYFNNAFASNMDIDGGGIVTVTNDLLNDYGASIDIPDGTLVVGGTITDNNNGINATCSDGCCGNCGALPVTVIAMEYRLVNNHVVLEWKTASELNNDYFTIEKSIDGKSFVNVGVVDGAGTSYMATEYQWKDKIQLQDITYYRLKQTDFDGSYSYQKVIKADGGQASSELRIMPNPIAQEGSIYVYGVGEESATWQIQTIKGQVLNEGVSFGQPAVVSTSGLGEGVYILDFQSGRQQKQVKIIIK
ncbi:T9SS type A sorting domain-containing protein [Fulvivirga ulvae]|uniref:T9SS type A sorting domain-containing protein n=1 Tax=Fulvivirga ulvae TaxID=2904245 RepID=UPI001F17A508|nr:T9SS type A sorting domain-containing protein [Fulvivirga ulvae]UII34069.1 T9SS type A sorting domain-containing protein [Fulvivirga ulvae]